MTYNVKFSQNMYITYTKPWVGNQDIFGRNGMYPLLSLRERKIFKRLSGVQYRNLHNVWRCIGLSILLNRDLDRQKCLTDYGLIQSIQTYKIWVIKQYLSKARLTTIDPIGSETNPTGPVKFHYELRNYGSLLKHLKCLFDNVKYYSSGTILDERPRLSTVLPGGIQSGNQVLGMYGGHLQKWRRPWKLPRTLHNRKILCQLGTIGRALPPPPKDTLEKAFVGLMGRLTTPSQTTDEFGQWLVAIGTSLGRRHGKMSCETHISVSSSSCFERTVKDGGRASYMLEEVNKFLDQPLSEVVEGYVLESPCDLYDPWGRLIVSKERLTELLDSKEETPLVGDIITKPTKLPGESDSEFNLRMANYQADVDEVCSAYFGDHNTAELIQNRFNHLFGDAILIWAATVAMDHGRFDCEPVGRIALFVHNQVIKFHPDGRLPKATVRILSEPGAKARPLTTNMAWLTTILQSIRQMTEPCLRRDPRARASFTDPNKLWSILPLIRKLRKCLVKSADYSSATDTIPLKYIRCIWTGYLSGLGISSKHPIWVFLELVFSQRELVPSDDMKHLSSEFHDFCPHVTGSFMGEPVSFLTLTLLNLAVLDIVNYLECHALHHSVLGGVPGEDVANFLGLVGQLSILTGDDLLDFGEGSRAELLDKVIALVGFLRSVGKDFTSTDFGTFTEEHILWNDATQQYEYFDKVKARLLTPMSREYADHRQSILGKGSMLNTAQLWIAQTEPQAVQMINDIFISLFEEILEQQLFVQVPLELSPSCGGINLPIRQWNETKVLFYRELSVISQILDLGPFEGFLARIELSTLNLRSRWGLNPVDVTKYLRAVLKEDQFVVQTTIPEDNTGLFSIGTVLDYMSEFLGYEPSSDRKIGFREKTEIIKTFGFVTLEAAIEKVTRTLEFTQQFVDPTNSPPSRLTFTKYLNKSNKYWKRARARYPYIKGSETRFTSTNSVGYAMTMANGLFLSIKHPMFELIRFGPSLRMSLDRRAERQTSVNQIVIW